MAGHRHAGKVDLRVLGCSRGNSGQLQGCGTAASADGKRVEGIEPSSLAWKAIALPLSYTRVERPPDRADLSRGTLAWHAGLACWVGILGLGILGSGECRIRTCEGIIHQIYSLTPLTARETPRVLSPRGVVAATDALVVCRLDAPGGCR